jgi:AraC-like DNA-binding protein
MAPYRYLIHVRVAHARKLLERGVATAEAALEVGFCDQSHLHRHFVRQVGTTPGAYARAVQERPSRGAPRRRSSRA